MSRSWRDIQHKNEDSPGRVARLDQADAELRHYYNKLRWRIVRAWDELRGKNKL